MASWPVSTIREKFFSYFEIRDYQKLSPNPVIIVDANTPLIDTYLNHCKRTVNDTVQIDSRSKSFYSLRCIDVSNGDDVTMDSFFKDSSHHCMTEVLGSWASGDCKQEAIRSSWELLTKTYKLPRERIYIKYFGGSKESCLDPDVDSFDMWKRYVPAERILASSTKADFWSSSDTGPCGPSVGIMFDLSGNNANPTFAANINDGHRFIEIWRLVFVQFNRQEDRLLRPLHAEHVITGLNIESLAAVLQNKKSLYDSDVFKHILEVIHYGAGDGIVKYSGKVGNEDNNRVDAAYRVVANHLRSIAAATTYCAEYGLPTGHREDLLKHADRRALVFGHKILDTKLDRYEIVVKNAVQVAGFYPIQMDIEKINTIVEDEVKIYKKIRAEDEQGILSVECNPAMTNSNLHPSLPPRKKERAKPKNQTKKNKQQQQKKRPPQLPLASVENEENTAQLSTPSVEDEDDATQQPQESVKNPESVKNEDDATQLPLASVKNEDNKNIGGPEMEISSIPNSVASTGEVYRMRQIDFLGHSTHIIHQDKNGPCPLISICNCLLLKGKINFECHLTEVPMEHLVHILQDLVKERLKIKVCYLFAEGSILDVVPTLAEGLDVDVKFNRTDGFSATPGTMLFDCLEIPLCHGWFADEEDMAGARLHSVETLTWAVKESHFSNVERMKKFLNGPQLTASGLACLHSDVVENVPSVLFWNKHFSTIIKYNGALYSLVNDEGYLETNVFWQTLNDTNGGGSYMKSDFMPIDLEQCATQSGELNCPPEIYFKGLEWDGMSLDNIVLEPGSEFSEQKTLFVSGTSLDVAATTRTGRVLALDILRDLIGSHSTKCSYNGAFGLRSIVLYNGRARICAPYCGEFTDAAVSNDFETYISDILERFRIDKVGLPAFFKELIDLLRRPGCFLQPRYFWDCVLTHLALKPPRAELVCLQAFIGSVVLRLKMCELTYEIY